jgi:hypothetical protein
MPHLVRHQNGWFNSMGSSWNGVIACSHPPTAMTRYFFLSTCPLLASMKAT